MRSNEAVSQRKRRAVLLGEEFREKSEMYTEFLDALSKRLDPVQMAVIHEFKARVEEYERCVTRIQLNGLSIQECIEEYASSMGQEERSAS